jgi:hypothetical protein
MKTTTHTRRRARHAIRSVALIVPALVLAIAASASANGTSIDAYGGDGRGTLPLTGLDVGVLVVGALLLIAAGLGLRMLARQQRSQPSE